MYRNRVGWTRVVLVFDFVVVMLIISLIAGLVPFLGPLCLGLYVGAPRNTLFSAIRSELKCPILLWVIAIAAVQYVPWALLSNKYVPHFLPFGHDQLALYQLRFFSIPCAGVLLFEYGVKRIRD